jgi:hypothetical protein
LPKAELNPLTNPALERNLSRWAEAYFSNPPGKREQAISRLLQEIKNETSEILIAEQARLEAVGSEEKKSGDTSSSQARSVDELFSETGSARNKSQENISAQPHRVVCPSCQFQNPLGHRYCGECGALLFGVPAIPGNGVAASAAPTTRAAPEAAPSVRPFTAPPDSEVQWLRERNLGTLYAVEPASSRGWKYAFGGLVIVLAGFAYLQWGSRLPSWIASPAATVAPAAKTAAQPTPGPAEAIPAPSVAAKPSGPAKPNDHQPARSVRNSSPLREGIQPAAQKSSLLGNPPAPKPPDVANGGSADLQLAQRYLEGSMGARDSAEAAKLLWKAVRQENTAAAVLLSELYARGDGVPKSCDQARLLLVAAAKHGLPQAAEQLRNLETRGCQ